MVPKEQQFDCRCVSNFTQTFLLMKKLKTKKDAMTPNIPIYYIASRELNYEVGKKVHNWGSKCLH